jgi:hypothetical protein
VSKKSKKQKPKDKSKKVHPEPIVNLVPPVETLPTPNNFWNSCIRELDQFPTTPCHLGKPEKNESGRVLKEPECPWWIDSEKHQYCYWRWVQSQSTIDGKMDPLPQNEIAKLFGCSSTKIHFVVKESVQKLQANGYAKILTEFLYDNTDTSTDGISIYSIPFDNISSEDEG